MGILDLGSRDWGRAGRDRKGAGNRQAGQEIIEGGTARSDRLVLAVNKGRRIKENKAASAGTDAQHALYLRGVGLDQLLDGPAAGTGFRAPCREPDVGMAPVLQLENDDPRQFLLDFLTLNRNRRTGAAAWRVSMSPAADLLVCACWITLFLYSP